MRLKDWDLYFLRIAREVSKHSKCLSRQIGAVLVKDKSIISTGYNGPARGVKHCNERDVFFYLKLLDENDKRVGFKCLELNECPRKFLKFKSGEGLQLCQAGHAERNALIQAARNGITTEGTTLYCYCTQICKDCAIEMANAGVKRLVFLAGGEHYDKYSPIILQESLIYVQLYKEEEL